MIRNDPDDGKTDGDVQASGYAGAGPGVAYDKSILAERWDSNPYKPLIEVNRVAKRRRRLCNN